MNKQIVLTTKQLTLALLVIILLVAVVDYVSALHATKKKDEESNGIMSDVVNALNHIFNNTETTKLAVGAMLEEQVQDVVHDEVQDRTPIGFKQQGRTGA